MEENRSGGYRPIMKALSSNRPRFRNVGSLHVLDQTFPAGNVGSCCSSEDNMTNNMTNNMSDNTVDSSTYYRSGNTSGSNLYSSLVCSSCNLDSSMNQCDRSALY
jgi:hypothetical protein